MKTHEVSNQSPSLVDINLYEIDAPLLELTMSRLDKKAISKIHDYGALMGADKWIKAGALANEHAPVFHSHDHKGYRVDEVTFHPAYHELMSLSVEHGLHASPWQNRSAGSHLARMAMYYLSGQNESGHGCPITMTFSSVPAIKKHLSQADEWIPKILSGQYDGSNRPYFEKQGLTIGMAMTEKQGGTDVRANTTTAVPLNKKGKGEPYLLTGHKWFCSAPMCDAFLTLAQTEAGLSCFLFPRWKPDGQKNDFSIQRIKDKLGNRSNASSEIEFDGAFAWLMGAEGRGVATIIEMVALTRYDCMIGSSAIMRRGLNEVLHHVNHRSVMGKKLIDQDLMRNVIADLALESTAALALTTRVALCLDRSGDKSEDLLLRLLTPIGKYWLTKRASPFLVEAMECLGGNGYVEQSILPRLYREAPVNAIWEGSGNVQCLDVMRAMSKSPEIIDVYIAELDKAKGIHPAYDQLIQNIRAGLDHIDAYNARRITNQLAIAMQTAQLYDLYDERFAKAFIQSRTDNMGQHMYGCLSDESAIDYVLSKVDWH